MAPRFPGHAQGEMHCTSIHIYITIAFHKILFAPWKRWKHHGCRLDIIFLRSAQGHPSEERTELPHKGKYTSCTQAMPLNSLVTTCSTYLIFIATNAMPFTM